MWFTVCFCSLPFTGYEPCALTNHTSSSTSRQFTPRVASQQELSSTSYCSFSVQALLVCYLILITQISKSSIPRSFLRWSVLATPCSLRLELPDSHVQHVPWSDHSFLRYSSFSFGDLKSLQSNFKIVLPCISGPSNPIYTKLLHTLEAPVTSTPPKFDPILWTSSSPITRFVNTSSGVSVL